MTTNTYTTDGTALLIVDPYNDFMSQARKFYERTKDTARDRAHEASICPSRLPARGPSVTRTRPFASSGRGVHWSKDGEPGEASAG
jgi:hypothetical protein